MKNTQKGFIVPLIISIVAVLLVGSGAYYFYGGSKITKLGEIKNLGCKKLNWDKTFCVDKMPDFPEKIGEFTLTRYSKVNWEKECKDYNGSSICTKTNQLQYYNKDQTMLIGVSPIFVDASDKDFSGYISQFTGKEVTPNVFELITKSLLTNPNKVFWKANSIDMVSISQYSYEKKSDGSMRNVRISKDTPITNNEVFKYFLEKYPPIK